MNSERTSTMLEPNHVGTFRVTWTQHLSVQCLAKSRKQSDHPVRTRMLCMKSVWSIQTFAVHKHLQVHQCFLTNICSSQMPLSSQILALFYNCFLFTYFGEPYGLQGGVSEPHWLKMISDGSPKFLNFYFHFKMISDDH